MPMDLRSLSSTLPHNVPQNQQNAPARPTDDDSPTAILMSAFKQAALSVTTLYRTANAEAERSRNFGYQDCLEDLLQLLEGNQIQQNSEVRKIREWVLSKQRSKFGGPRRRNDAGEDSEDEKARMPTNSPASPMPSDPQIPPQHDNHHGAAVPLRPPTPPTHAVNPVPTPPSMSQQHTSVHKENGASFSFRSSYRLPQHPPPPPSIPMLEDTDVVDVSSGAPTLLTQQPGFFSPQPQSRATSGAWKRRLPYDFLELAATAEKERDWVSKRGRLG